MPPNCQKISPGCFRYTTSLTRLDIPDTLKTIEYQVNPYYRAFDHSAISRFVLSPTSNLENIGGDSFADSKLTSIYIPKKTIFYAASFQNCPIEEIVIHPENPYYKTKDLVVFSDNNSTIYFVSPFKTGEYTVPSYVTKIGQSAFRTCSLSKVTIGNQVTNIETWCFAQSKIREIILPSNMLSIPEAMFAFCGTISTIQIPDSVTKIGLWAFYYCDRLNKIDLPKNLITLGDEVFRGCHKLKNLTLSAKLKEIGVGLFTDVGNINIISLNPEIFIDGFIMYKDSNQTLFSYYGVTENADLTIINKCNFIGKGIFTGKNLRNIYFDNNENISLDSYVFDSSTIKTISFPSGLKSLGIGTFQYCSKLSTVSFQGTMISSIPEKCFYQCSSLKSITLPTSITTIGKSAFEGCENIGDIGISKLENLQTISDSAFLKSGLTTANLANSVTLVGSRAFLQSRIANLTINCNIQNDLCRSCTNLKTLTMNDGVTEIGPYAFSGCSELTGFIIPQNLRRILDFAFESCSSLSSVRMVMYCTLESVEGGCFYGCINLKKIELSTYDRSYLFQNGALTFYNQSKLIIFLPYSGIINFVAPMDMKEIGRCAFMGSPSLQRVFFNGNKIETIGYQAFRDCRNLNLIFFASSNSITIGNNAFIGCPMLRKCGAFSIPESLQPKFIEQDIPKIAFSNDCPSLNSCQAIRCSPISIFSITPFITMLIS